jgi:hypothetical protein
LSPDTTRGVAQGEDFRRLPTVRAPSYSWSSLEGPAVYYGPWEYRLTATLLEVEHDGTIALDMAEMRGYIKIRAPTVRATVSMAEMLPDQRDWNRPRSIWPCDSNNSDFPAGSSPGYLKFDSPLEECHGIDEDGKRYVSLRRTNTAHLEALKGTVVCVKIAEQDSHAYYRSLYLVLGGSIAAGAYKRIGMLVVTGDEGLSNWRRSWPLTEVTIY